LRGAQSGTQQIVACERCTLSSSPSAPAAKSRLEGEQHLSKHRSTISPLAFLSVCHILPLRVVMNIVVTDHASTTLVRRGTRTITIFPYCLLDAGASAFARLRYLLSAQSLLPRRHCGLQEWLSECCELGTRRKFLKLGFTRAGFFGSVD
jgi:hypothetical protein